VLLAELGLREEQIEQFFAIRAGIVQAIESPLLHELLSQDTVVALLPPPSGSESLQLEEYIGESLLLICRPRHQAGLLEFLAKTLARDMEVKNWPGGGDSRIRRYVLEDGTRFYTASQPGPDLCGPASSPH